MTIRICLFRVGFLVFDSVRAACASVWTLLHVGAMPELRCGLCEFLRFLSSTDYVARTAHSRSTSVLLEHIEQVSVQHRYGYEFFRSSDGQVSDVAGRVHSWKQSVQRVRGHKWCRCSGDGFMLSLCVSPSTIVADGYRTWQLRFVCLIS